MKDTIVINLFAGPGAGKSTGAAYVFSKLKLLGIDAEFVTEFAKDKVWENNEEVFKCQLYITGKQTFKISRVYGKVDVIITDSPIATGAQYTDDADLQKVILKEFNKFNNLNVFINRTKPYNSNGRNQSEDEASSIDMSTYQWLKDNNVEFVETTGDLEGYDKLVEIIKDKCNLVKENEFVEPYMSLNEFAKSGAKTGDIACVRSLGGSVEYHLIGDMFPQSWNSSLCANVLDDGDFHVYQLGYHWVGSTDMFRFRPATDKEKEKFIDAARAMLNHETSTFLGGFSNFWSEESLRDVLNELYAYKYIDSKYRNSIIKRLDKMQLSE